jgi:hypothetical protein
MSMLRYVLVQSFIIGGTFVNPTSSQEYFAFKPASFVSSSSSNGSSKGLPEGWVLRELFGGAIVCALPSTFEDISVIRQVIL